MTLAIKQSEYEERLAGLAEQLIERSLTGAVLFDPYYVLYYAGFAFAPTERPIAFVLNAEGKGGMLVPRLEREHAQANASVDHVADYPEYPSETHPTESLRGLLEEMGVRASPSVQTRMDIRGCSAIAALRSPSSSAQCPKGSPAS